MSLPHAIHENVFGEVYTQKEFTAEYGLDDGTPEDEYEGEKVFDGENLVSPEAWDASQNSGNTKGA